MKTYRVFSWMVGSIGLSVVAAACTIFEIVRYMAELLTPWTMIFTQIAKLACVSILLVVDIFAYLQHHGDQFSVVGFAIDGLSMYVTLECKQGRITIDSHQRYDCSYSLIFCFRLLSNLFLR